MRNYVFGFLVNGEGDKGHWVWNYFGSYLFSGSTCQVAVLGDPAASVCGCGGEWGQQQPTAHCISAFCWELEWKET